METKTTNQIEGTPKLVSTVVAVYEILKTRLGGLPETPTIDLITQTDTVTEYTLTTDSQKATVENCGVFANHIKEFYYKFNLLVFANGSWRCDGNIWYSFLTGGSNGNEISFRVYKKDGEINIEMKPVF